MTRLRQCEWWLSNRRGMKQKCKMRIFKLLCWKKWINSDRNSNKVYRLYSNAFNATERSRSNIDRSIHKDSSKEIKTCCRIFLKNKQLNNEEPKISLNLRLVNVRKNLRMSLRDKFRRKNIIQTQKSTCPVFSERLVIKKVKKWTEVLSLQLQPRSTRQIATWQKLRSMTIIQALLEEERNTHLFSILWEQRCLPWVVEAVVTWVRPSQVQSSLCRLWMNSRDFRENVHHKIRFKLNSWETPSSHSPQWLSRKIIARPYLEYDGIYLAIYSLRGDFFK